MYGKCSKGLEAPRLVSYFLMSWTRWPLIGAKVETRVVLWTGLLGQIKNKCVSGNGSENFRQGRHMYFFLEKNIILCISPFKMHKIIFSPENLKKILGFTSRFR